MIGFHLGFCLPAIGVGAFRIFFALSRVLPEHE